MKKIVLITGASSGIGEACAHVFARENYKLILTARRAEKLDSVRDSLVSEYNAEVLCLNFDVRNRAEVEHQLLQLPNDWNSIDVLINNAGLSLGLEPFYEGDINDWETMIDTNVKGLLYVSKVVASAMIKKQAGHIINIGSVAGKESYANGNVYCSTKAAVDSLSRSMRLDLVKYGIKVSAIHPGAVETEFSIVRFKGDVQRANNVYKGFEPLHPEDVAEVVYFTACRPSHVNINDLLLMPTAQANATTIHKFVSS